MSETQRASAKTQSLHGLLPTLSIHDYQPDKETIDNVFGIQEVLNPKRREASIAEFNKQFEQPVFG